MKTKLVCLNITTVMVLENDNGEILGQQSWPLTKDGAPMTLRVHAAEVPPEMLAFLAKMGLALGDIKPVKNGGKNGVHRSNAIRGVGSSKQQARSKETRASKAT